MTKHLIIFIFFLVTRVFGQTSQVDTFRNICTKRWDTQLPKNPSDTINFTDSNGRKQGHWIYHFKYDHYVCVDTTRKRQEGRYKDNLKTGLWTEYFCNGNIKNSMTFVGGRPEGPGKMFYENGKIRDEGVFKKKRWVSSIFSPTIYHDDTTFKFNYKVSKDSLHRPK